MIQTNLLVHDKVSVLLSEIFCRVESLQEVRRTDGGQAETQHPQLEEVDDGDQTVQGLLLHQAEAVQEDVEEREGAPQLNDDGNVSVEEVVEPVLVVLCLVLEEVEQTHDDVCHQSQAHGCDDLEH